MEKRGKLHRERNITMKKTSRRQYYKEDVLLQSVKLVMIVHEAASLR